MGHAPFILGTVPNASAFLVDKLILRQKEKNTAQPTAKMPSQASIPVRVIAPPVKSNINDAIDDE